MVLSECHHFLQFFPVGEADSGPDLQKFLTIPRGDVRGKKWILQICVVIVSWNLVTHDRSSRRRRKMDIQVQILRNHLWFLLIRNLSWVLFSSWVRNPLLDIFWKISTREDFSCESTLGPKSPSGYFLKNIHSGVEKKNTATVQTSDFSLLTFFD